MRIVAVFLIVWSCLVVSSPLVATSAEAGPSAIGLGSPAPAAPTGNAAGTNDGLSKGVTDTVGGARAILVDALLLRLLLAFLAAAWWETRRNSVLIEPIEVPKDLADKGYTSHVIARRLAAEISGLQRAARIRARLEEGFELSSAQIDFAVTSAGISYRALIRYVRQLLGLPEERVQGELVCVLCL